jgi:hypothetical protein
VQPVTASDIGSKRRRIAVFMACGQESRFWTTRFDTRLQPAEFAVGTTEMMWSCIKSM